jgi:alpha-galactosidase
MRYTDEVWPSDNTDAFDRLRIQDGFTYAYSPGIMMAWMTDSPSQTNQRLLSVEYRFLSAMQGSLGIGGNLNQWNSEDLAIAKKMVTQYKQIREIVQHGSLYRLISPRNGSEQSVTETVSLDQRSAVTFAFLHSSGMLYPFPTIYLRGLIPNSMYRLHVMDGKAAKETPEVASGCSMELT